MSKAYYPIQPISKTLLRGQETKDVKKETIPRPFFVIEEPNKLPKNG
jgi:hypothetical protein